MKSLVWIFLLSSSFSFGQNFRWEFRAFMLREFVKENSIQQISTYSLSRHPCPTCRPDAVLIFDEQGRLLELQDKLNFKPIRIEYGYRDFPYYLTKKLFIMDSDSTFIQDGEYKIELDSSERIITEIQLNNGGDTIRINKIFFDQNYFIRHRNSRLPQANYSILSNYSTDEKGRYLESSFKTSSKEKSDSLIDKYYSNTIYDKGRVVNALQFEFRFGTKDTSRNIIYHFNKENPLEPNGCTHQFYKKNERSSSEEYLINYTKNGFIREFFLLPDNPNDTTYTDTRIGKGFEYIFFDNKVRKAKNIDRFIGIYLSPNMIFNVW